ncbi:hypothetical protein Cgig2_017522 [Carnegiea gigantea]|uniref:Uncharacterized protein n=1 Tax=Carnegiea gigantea TaxID=171969 RepID=A0A9Q1K3E2_9CARY|nr:hypothetical protein Cgig2_017522 [Carnegiea gigantea]
MLNLRGIGTANVGRMVKKILEKGTMEKNSKETLSRIISTCIKGCCSLFDVKTNIHSCDELQVLHSHRVEFRGMRCKDLYFPTTMHWTVNQTFGINHGSPPTPEQPCPECGSEREPPITAPNDPIEMTKEDVHAMLALPTSPLEVQVASTCEPTNEYTKLLKQRRTKLNLRRTWTAKVRKMVEKTLEKGDHE